jgi:hypothetical protein
LVNSLLFFVLSGGFMKNAFRKVGITVAVVLVACVTFATPVGATARMPQVIPANSVVAARSPQKVEFIAQVFQAVRVYAPIVLRQVTEFIGRACPGLNSSTGSHPQALAPLTENSLD